MRGRGKLNLTITRGFEGDKSLLHATAMLNVNPLPFVKIHRILQHTQLTLISVGFQEIIYKAGEFQVVYNVTKKFFTGVRNIFTEKDGGKVCNTSNFGNQRSLSD